MPPPYVRHAMRNALDELVEKACVCVFIRTLRNFASGLAVKTRYSAKLQERSRESDHKRHLRSNPDRNPMPQVEC